MSVYLDVYFGPEESLLPSEVEEAIDEAITGDGRIVGSGTGATGSNIDIEISDHADADAVTERVRVALASAGVRMDTVLVRSDWVDRKTVGAL